MSILFGNNKRKRIKIMKEKKIQVHNTEAKCSNSNCEPTIRVDNTVLFDMMQALSTGSNV